MPVLSLTIETDNPGVTATVMDLVDRNIDSFGEYGGGVFNVAVALRDDTDVVVQAWRRTATEIETATEYVDLTDRLVGHI
jgi:hypothetical protein